MNPFEQSDSGAWRYASRSPQDTERLGRAIGNALQGGEILALYGELGTGKTTLVRGIAAGAGAPPQRVTSPTFVLIHEYHGRLRLAHADLYRIMSADELPHTGLSDYLDDHTVVAIEWAERAGGDLPGDRLEIRLSHVGNATRQFTMNALGSRSQRLLSCVRDGHLEDAR
jgi:tRNA threonylcarbamoyladenosine biosynthesis protein TsaE